MNLTKAFEERLSNEREDATAILKALHQEAPTSIRINPFKTGNPDLEAVPWNQHGYYLPSRPVFTGDPLWHAGAYYVQEASSMLTGTIARKLYPHAREHTIIDLCAAPGGKSTDLATWAHEQDHWLISNEIIPKRAAILQENLIKWGLAYPTVLNNRPEEIGRNLQGIADLLVIDAPCSGEGLFRKDPDSVVEWTPDIPAMCAVRQKEIVAHAWPSLKEGGYLIYSTCTFAACENEEMVRWMIETLDANPIQLPDGITGPEGSAENGYRMLPYRTKGEGFFVAILQKTSTASSLRGKPQRWSRLNSDVLKSTRTIIDWDGQASAVHPHFQALNKKQLEGLRIVSPGLVLSYTQGKYTHAAALHQDVDLPYEMLSLDTETAIQFLKREALSIQQTKGFVQLAYDGLLLGLGKSIGNRINNLYPKGWRIINPSIQAGFSLSDHLSY